MIRVQYTGSPTAAPTSVGSAALLLLLSLTALALARSSVRGHRETTPGCRMAPEAARSVRYNLTDLRALDGNYTYAEAVNNQSEVVGSAVTAKGYRALRLTPRS